MIRFHTLGPAGSCHEHALKRYLAFQGVEEADIALCDDLDDAGSVDAIVELMRFEST